MSRIEPLNRRPADSPSPLKGERAGVRGENARLASSLERRLVGSPDAVFSAHCDHEPASALFSLSSPEGGEGWGEEGRLSPRESGVATRPLRRDASITT